MNAQQTSDQPVWQGTLRNASRAPIAGAKIRLSGGRITAEATTGSDGKFHLQPLPPGPYRLTIEADGRVIQYAQPSSVASAMPHAGIELSSRGELSVVALDAQAAATGGEALSSQAVSELPLSKRDFS